MPIRGAPPDSFHRFADAMAEIPRGLIGLEAQMPLQLLRAHSLFRLRHECDGKKPFVQWQVRIVKQCAGGCGELLFTRRLKTLVELANILLLAARGNAGNLVSATGQTADAFRPAPGF